MEVVAGVLLVAVLFTIFGGLNLTVGMLRRRRFRHSVEHEGAHWAGLVGLASTGTEPYLFDANVTGGGGFSVTPRLVVFDESAFAVVAFRIRATRVDAWDRARRPTIILRGAFPFDSVNVDGDQVVVTAPGFVSDLRSAGWLATGG